MMLNDDEIIAAVQETPEDEGDVEDDVSTPVSNKLVLESIQNIHNYLQQNNDIKVSNSFVSGLKDLKWKIDKKQISSLKQTSIDVYLNKE